MNTHKPSKENPIESKETSDPNEAISDSLAKTIRAYDKESKQLPSHSIWSRKKEVPGIGELRKELHEYSGGFLETEQKLLDAIRQIVTDTKPKLDTRNTNLPIYKVLTYLEERLKYHDKKQRRTPEALTAKYKILLIGDGWVHRADLDNPLIKDINKDLNSANEHTRLSAALRQIHLKLENRDFTPDQVYTVDRLSTGLPDLISNMKELKPDDLPKAYFDFAYFEGFGFENEEETKSAINVALTFVKDDGLILYSTPESALTLLAKSGNITQEKLDKIPQCIKTSANRHLKNFASFEEIAPHNTQKINLTDETRVINRPSPR